MLKLRQKVQKAYKVLIISTIVDSIFATSSETYYKVLIISTIVKSVER